MNNFYNLLLLFMYSKNVHPTAVGDNQIINPKIVNLPMNNEMSKHTLKSVLEIARKRGKQEPGVDIGMFVSGISDAFNNVLKYNLTADNLIADTSKLIPEDTRGTLENVIDNIPEPINSILKGPLEQFNGFLQLGKTTTEPSNRDYRTVSTTMSTVRTTQATTQSLPPMQPPSENSKPQTPQPADQVVSIISSEIISSYPVDSNVQTEPVSNKLESPKDMEPHIADSFQNVSSTLTGSKIIAVAITNTVSNWFQNISKDFHISKRPLIVNGQEDVVDDEDEKLPPAVYIPKSNINTKPSQATASTQLIPNKNILPNIITPLNPQVVQNSAAQPPNKPYRRRPPFANNNAQNIPNEPVQQSQPLQQFQPSQQYPPGQQLQPSNQFQSQQQYQPAQQFQPNSNGQQIQSNQQNRQQFPPGQQFQPGQGQQYQQGQGQQYQQGQGQQFQQGQGQQFQQGQGQQFQQGQGQQFQQGQGQQFQQNPGQQFQQSQLYQPNQQIQQGQQNQQFQELQQSQQFQPAPQFQAVQSFPQIVVQSGQLAPASNPSISSSEADILKQLGILSNPNVQVITIPNVALAAAQTSAPVAAEVPVTESPATPPTEVDEDDDDAETSAS